MYAWVWSKLCSSSPNSLKKSDHASWHSWRVLKWAPCPPCRGRGSKSKINKCKISKQVSYWPMSHISSGSFILSPHTQPAPSSQPGGVAFVLASWAGSRWDEIKDKILYRLEFCAWYYISQFSAHTRNRGMHSAQRLIIDWRYEPILFLLIYLWGDLGANEGTSRLNAIRPGILWPFPWE